MRTVAVVKHVLLGIPAFYVVFTLFGAPFFADLEWTLALSVLQSLLTVAPICYAFDGTTEEVVEAVLGSSKKSAKQVRALVCALASLAGTWFGAFVIPLDWDRWWQRYPIPCAIGAVAGCLASIVILYLYSLLHRLGCKPPKGSRHTKQV